MSRKANKINDTLDNDESKSLKDNLMRQANDAKKKKNLSAMKLQNKRMSLAVKTDETASKQA